MWIVVGQALAGALTAWLCYRSTRGRGEVGWVVSCLGFLAGFQFGAVVGLPLAGVVWAVSKAVRK